MTFEDKIKESGGMIVMDQGEHKVAWCFDDMVEGLSKAGFITYTPKELEIIAKNKSINPKTIKIINSVKKYFGGSLK